MLVNPCNPRNQSFSGQKLNYYSQFKPERLKKIIASLKTCNDEFSQKRLELAEKALEQKIKSQK